MACKEGVCKPMILLDLKYPMRFSGACFFALFKLGVKGVLC